MALGVSIGRSPALLALTIAALAGGAWAVVGGGGSTPSGGDPVERPAPAPPAGPAPTPEGRSLLAAPDVSPETRLKRQLSRLEVRLAEVRRLMAEGRWKEALALLAALRKEKAEYPDVADFDARLSALTVEIASREGVQQLSGVKAGPEARGLSREELQRRIEATRAVMALAGSVEDVDALERHLQRILLANPDPKSEAVSDRLMRNLLDDRRGRHKQPTRPPVASPEDAEQRRLDQLERLRQRGAVGLLDAIHGALAWLALHQAEDGSFHEAGCHARCKALKHEPTCLADPGANQKRHAVATTALAALAWLDFRDQDLHGLFDPYLGSALAWLGKAQRADGGFNGSLYEGSIAVMALGQAAASTGLEPVREACSRGLVWLERSMARGGGWRYGPGAAAADLSVTAWGAQAMEAARAAGVDVPQRLMYGLDEFLGWTHLGDHRFSYVDGIAESRSLSPAGMLLARLVWPEVEAEVAKEWTAYLGSWPVKSVPTLYTVYYGVRVSILLNNALADPWRAWAFTLADGKRSQRTPGLVVPQVGVRPSGGVVVDHVLGTLTLEHALYLR